MRKLIPQMEPWFDQAEAKSLYTYMKSGGWVTEFKKTEELERMICQFTNARYCIMTNNGTVSLILALLALDLKPGDEVIIPNLTMIASPNAAVILGLKPILVDVENDTLCLDLDKAKKALSKKTKALMYIAFNGRTGNMHQAVEFAKKNKLHLIEDSAQALGSSYHGRQLGTFGDIGSFSFSVPKIITTGQGGALITNSQRLNKKIRRLKDFGRERGGIDIHNYLGWNFKFTDLQAVIGIEQMKKLDWRIHRKKAIYQLYFRQLKNIKGIEFIPTNLKETTPWFVDIYIKNPKKLAGYLKEKGIGTRPIYPPVHHQKIYRHGHRKHFPVSEYYTSRGLWLPSSSKLSDRDITYICTCIRKYYQPSVD